MTRKEAIEVIKKSIECHERDVCGIAEDCDDCPLYVDNNMECEAHKVLLACIDKYKAKVDPQERSDKG